MADLKVGDVVWLKSGGPPMTIETIRDDGIVWCTWFEEIKRCSSSFHIDQLTNQSPHQPGITLTR